jgi:DHA1 family tetracycline resistance protein-like MFS transporter
MQLVPPTAREAETALSCPLGRSLVAAVGTICVTSFLYNAGQSTFDSFFPVYSSEVLGLGPRQIGGWLTTLAAVSFTISTAGFARAQKAFGLTMTTVLGLSLVAAGLALIGLAPGTNLTMTAAVLYVAGIPLFTPAVPILLMQCVPANKRG